MSRCPTESKNLILNKDFRSNKGQINAVYQFSTFKKLQLCINTLNGIIEKRECKMEEAAAGLMRAPFTADWEEASLLDKAVTRHWRTLTWNLCYRNMENQHRETSHGYYSGKAAEHKTTYCTCTQHPWNVHTHSLKRHHIGLCNSPMYYSIIFKLRKKYNQWKGRGIHSINPFPTHTQHQIIAH